MDWLKLYQECEKVEAARGTPLATSNKTLGNLKPQRVILSMWKETYLRRADTLQEGLNKAYGEAGVAQWTANLDRRQEVSHRQATHRIPLVFYLGHGRERGWSGYRGLRIHHLQPPVEPMGLVVSLSCRTLDFGRELVKEGYAQAFLGADEAMGIPGLTRLVATIATVFANEYNFLNTADDFLTFTDRYVSLSTSVELHNVWSQLQLLGPGTTKI